MNKCVPSAGCPLPPQRHGNPPATPPAVQPAGCHGCPLWCPCARGTKSEANLVAFPSWPGSGISEAPLLAKGSQPPDPYPRTGDRAPKPSSIGCLFLAPLAGRSWPARLAPKRIQKTIGDITWPICITRPLLPTLCTLERRDSQILVVLAHPVIDVTLTHASGTRLQGLTLPARNVLTSISPICRPEFTLAPFLAAACAHVNRFARKGGWSTLLRWSP